MLYHAMHTLNMAIRIDFSTYSITVSPALIIISVVCIKTFSKRVINPDLAEICLLRSGTEFENCLHSTRALRSLAFYMLLVNKIKIYIVKLSILNSPKTFLSLPLIFDKFSLHAFSTCQLQKSLYFGG